MAKAYALPEEVPWADPDFKKYDYRKEQMRQAEHEKKLAEWCRSRNTGDCVGEVIYTGRGDGYACYMVESEKPLRLIHLPYGDAWHADPIWISGLRLSHVRKMVECNRDPLFGSSKLTEEA